MFSFSHFRRPPRCPFLSLPGRPGFARSADAPGETGRGASLVKPTKKTPASAPCSTSLPWTGSTAVQVSCVGSCGVWEGVWEARARGIAQPPPCSRPSGAGASPGHASCLGQPSPKQLQAALANRRLLAAVLGRARPRQPRFRHVSAPRPRSARSDLAARTRSSGARAPRRRLGSTANGGHRLPERRGRRRTASHPGEAAGPRPETAAW